MPPERTDGDAGRPGLRSELREWALAEAQEVADKALERLLGVAHELPPSAVDYVKSLHDNPAAERRKAVRMADQAVPVVVSPLNGPSEAGEVIDRCPTGLAVLLPCPAGVGNILLVRMPGGIDGGQWLSVEVKYYRKEACAWAAGCEVVGDQRPK
jgi:hypothetical protein